MSTSKEDVVNTDDDHRPQPQLKIALEFFAPEWNAGTGRGAACHHGGRVKADADGPRRAGTPAADTLPCLTSMCPGGCQTSCLVRLAQRHSGLSITLG
ncbi:hypothetical protein Q1695_006838 [Nippostrongylus brasiliensis]|nr:hypothetical protein Q1695_006838 [Nippostrongylus brasiliensis]